MRRVDWPDEPGWWWAIDLKYTPGPYYYKPHKPHFFIVGGNDEITGMDGWKKEWDSSKKYEFEGPIEEPKVPLRFEVEGTIQVVHCTWSGASSWKEITVRVKTTGKLPPAGTRDKQFRITFEELP